MVFKIRHLTRFPLKNLWRSCNWFHKANAWTMSKYCSITVCKVVWNKWSNWKEKVQSSSGQDEWILVTLWYFSFWLLFCVFWIMQKNLSLRKQKTTTTTKTAYLMHQVIKTVQKGRKSTTTKKSQDGNTFVFVLLLYKRNKHAKVNMKRTWIWRLTSPKWKLMLHTSSWLHASLLQSNTLNVQLLDCKRCILNDFGQSKDI